MSGAGDPRESMDSFDSGEGLDQSRDDLDENDSDAQSGGGPLRDSYEGQHDTAEGEEQTSSHLQYDSAGESSMDGSDIDADFGGRPNLGDFDYSNLQVSEDIHQIFEYINGFKPADIELNTTLKPFIPEYIPAVGDIDAFLKVPPPDGRQELLGLATVDEPATIQTDPTVLEMQLRQITKQRDLQPVQVRGLEHANLNPKTIKAWVTKVADLHKSKPAPTVTYQKQMPDIESLMQEWPHDMEKLLETIKLPTADLDVDIKTFSRIICSIVDIPIHTNVTEGLHVLFTTYSAFRENIHFRAS